MIRIYLPNWISVNQNDSLSLCGRMEGEKQERYAVQIQKNVINNRMVDLCLHQHPYSLTHSSPDSVLFPSRE